MSRRAAEAVIERGGVTVDGITARLGDSADPETQSITVSGQPLPRRPGAVYILLHKPRDVTTTLRDPHALKTVRDLLPPELGYLVPVGRLDKDSEGLLLMTNDGRVVQRLTHPSSEIEKEYHVTVRGNIAAALPVLQAPMLLDEQAVRPAAARVLPDGGLAVTIKEGRKRQVRHMCKVAGLTVTRLVRVREGKLLLGALPPGQWRFLTEQEIEYVRSL